MVLTDRDNEIIIYGYDTVRDMERAWRDIMRDLAAKFKSDGMFGCDKNAQLALLVNDALLKAEQKMARKENNESDF